MAVMALLGASAAVYAQQITLTDIVDGKYAPRAVREVRSLADGESYSCVSEDGLKIERCSFRTGEVTEVLFDASVARGAAIRRWKGM